MKWDELKDHKGQPYAEFRPTDVECPECGAYLMRQTGIVLSSNPPQSVYICPGCGFRGTA